MVKKGPMRMKVIDSKPKNLDPRILDQDEIDKINNTNTHTGEDSLDDTGMPRIELKPLELGVALHNIVASIALQEGALARIMNAEGHKIQRVIELEGVTTGMLADINRSVTGLVGAVADIEDSLQRKLLYTFGIFEPLPEPEGEIELGTRDRITGLPIAGVRWVLRRIVFGRSARADEFFLAQTDSNGAFIFDHVPAGMYSLTLAEPVAGYITPSLFTVIIEADGSAIIWEGGPDDEEAERHDANGFIIYLDRIAFTLITKNCDVTPPIPLEGITWVLTNLLDSRLTYESITNSEGEFSFTYLPTGRYSLALKEDTAIGLLPLTEDYTILYIDDADIRLCHVPVGGGAEVCEEANNEVICVYPIAFVLTTVDCLSDEPMEDVTWVLTNLTTEEMFVSTTDSIGEFSFEFVPAGLYSLTLERVPDGYNDLSMEYTIEVDVDGNVTFCEIDLETGPECEPSDGASVCLCKTL